ncbi:MAG: aldo/keto reductase [bacterium]|nr:aldo/keto reductase [bacterium]
MKIPLKKLKNGFAMPEYGLGTWGMAGRFEHDSQNDDALDIGAIKTAIKLGVTHIDTAEVYADGHAEILTSEAIKSIDREKLFITSKVSGEHLSFDGVINACKKSLDRLKTSYLDLYLIHKFNPELPLKETMRALDRLVAEGLVKSIGVSNFNVRHLKKAQDYTKNKIVCNQVHYSLEFRGPERYGLLDFCQKNDVLITAWRPVGKGKFNSNPPPILQEMCKKYYKTPSQIAINWLVTQPNVITISKTRSIEHLNENLGGVGWYMEKEDIDRLQKEYPDQKDVSDSVPLA